MIKKTTFIAAVVAMTGWLATKTAYAAAGIADQTADTLSEKIVTLAKSIIEPLGAAVIFVSIVIAAMRIIVSSGRPEERSSAISSLPYILGGGILLGGAMIVAGFVIGAGKGLVGQ